MLQRNRVPVFVDDGEAVDSLSNTFDLTVIVSPVNDAPEIIGQVELTTLEEVSLEITLDSLYVTDVDNVYPDGFTLTVLEGENYTAAGTTITPVLDFFGALTVPVYIDDGGFEYSQSDTFDLFIEVINVNDAPVLTEIGDQETLENNPLEIALSALDVDEDSLTFSAFSYDPNVTAVMDGETLTLTPADNWYGTVTIVVTVSDGLLGDSETFELTVISVNNPPVLAAIGAQSTDEDTPLTITLSASDVEGDELDFSASSDNDTVAVFIDSDQLTMTPDPNYFGTANITVSVSDGFLTAEETFVLTINPVPDAPMALNVSISPAVPSDNTDLSLSYDYLDEDGDSELGTIIHWFKDGVEQEVFADFLTIPSSATACAEEWYAEVIPYDGEVYGDTVASNTVEICGENDPPVWADIPDQHINENSGDNILSMEGLIEDESLALLEFNVESNSDAVHLSAGFEGSDLILTTLIENYNTLDPIILSLTASDGEYADTTDLYVYIDPVNYAPVLVVIGSSVL